MSADILINSLPNNKTIDWSKFKAFADDNLNVAEMAKIVFDKVEKHCGKRCKCWLPAFSPFPTMFSKASFSGLLQVGILVW